MENGTFIQELLKNKSELNVLFLTDFNTEKALQNICGLLNSDGGWILIGHNGKDSVQLDLNEDMIHEFKLIVNSQISPQPLVYIAKESDGKNKILLINVLKGSRQPYTYNNKFYIFSGGLSVLADSDEISLLLRSSNEFNSTWEKNTAIDCTINDLNRNEISKTISEAGKLTKDKVLPNDPLEFLNYFKLSDYSNIKNGAVVLFGNEPRNFLSQCRIRISVLPQGKLGNRIGDTAIIESNLFQSFNEVQEYFLKYNPLISNFNDEHWDRKSQFKFPNDALDEAIVNAMVHRDYGDVSGEITINIYEDKIEIINSGEIPNDIITGKTKVNPHHSILRNPTIAHMFFIRGKMEKLGRGLTLISKRFVEYGYRKPEWTFQSGYTTLTLFSKGLDIHLNDRMIIFLKKFKEKIFSRQDYEDFFGSEIVEKTARNDLSKLSEFGFLVKRGRGSNTKYERTNKKLPDITG